MSTQSQKARKTYVFLSASLLVIAIVLLAAQAIERTGPAYRIRSLMPTIRAQAIDEPLDTAKLRHKLEMPPARAGEAPSRFVTLDGLSKDTLVFLNFWGAFCEPCVRELPSMRALARKLADKNFSMVAVSYDDDWETILAFFDGAPRDFHVWRDPKDEDSGPDQSLRMKFGTEKLPETYVIRNGQILARFVGERDWTDGSIVEYFERLLELK
jgi:cytochrome c biogenesis protein CcmG, thiol:disulfide interchange protein DsbE